MLSDDDKRWFAKEMSATGTGHPGPLLAGRGHRIAQRLDELEVRLIAEFQKWTVSGTDDPRVEASALRATDLELKALHDGADKLG